MSTLRWSAPFEDLAVGERFATRGRTVTGADVVTFAELTGDHHPQHCDAEWAALGPFGQRIAHGMLIVSYSVGLVPLDPARVLALRRLRDVVFKRPVGFGDTITVEGGIEQLRRVSHEAGLVSCRWSVLNQRGDLCARMTVEVLWRAGPVAATRGAAAGSLT